MTRGDAGEEEASQSIWENLSSGFDETPDAVLHKEIIQTAQSLPDSAADALLLSAVYGCSTRELAGVLGITIEAAKKRLQRARIAVPKAKWKRVKRDDRSRISESLKEALGERCTADIPDPDELEYDYTFYRDSNAG